MPSTASGRVSWESASARRRRRWVKLSSTAATSPTAGGDQDAQHHDAELSQRGAGRDEPGDVGPLFLDALP
jgi:hypothetical protein